MRARPPDRFRARTGSPALPSREIHLLAPLRARGRPRARALLRPLLLLSLPALALSGPRGRAAEAPAAPGAAGAAGAAAPELLPVEPRAPRWLEGAGEAAGGRRYAILAGVGKHPRHPIWDLPWVRADLELLEETLREKAGFHEVSRLEDSEVSREALETRLKSVLARLGGEDNLVLLYWTGHGFLDRFGEERYFLAHTDERRAGDRIVYTNTLGESDIADLLAPIRRSSKAHVVFVADACRTQVMAPAPGAGRRPLRVSVADVTVYSTARPGFAVPRKDQEHSAFCDGFVAALEALSPKPAVAVSELARGVAEHLKEQGIAQEPQVVEAAGGAAGEVRIFDRTRLSLGVRAIDGLTGLEVQGAVVKLLEREAESPARFAGLAEGRYRVEVSHPESFRALAGVDLDEKRSGGVLEVALYPRFEILAGAVQDGRGRPLSGVEVELTGSLAGFLKDYHTSKARADAAGRYRFLVPPGARVRGVEAPAGAREAQVLPVDLSKLEPRAEVLPESRWLLRTYDLGVLVVQGEAPVRVDELGLEGPDALVWKEAEKFVAEGRTEDLDIAVSYYRALVPKVAEARRDLVRERMRGAWRAFLSHLKARGRYAEGERRAAEALRDFPGDAFFTELKETCAREAIPEDLREKVNLASRAVAEGEFRRAEGLYRELEGRAARLTPYYRELASRNLEQVVEKLFQDAFTSLGTARRAGDVERAVRSYEEARRLDPESPLLAPWPEKIAPYLDRGPPEVVLLDREGRPLGRGPLEVAGDAFRFKARVRDDRALEALFLNGREWNLGGGREEEVDLGAPLAEGENRIAVKVRDTAGREAEAQVVVVRRAHPVVAGFTYAGKNPQGYDEYRHDRTGMVFVYLPGGRFRMGSPESQEVRDSDEGPVHEVRLSPFLIAKHEVTQEVWERVMGSNPSGFRQPGHPVEQVSWEDCQAFCRKTGLRLPSEAEWEYACRGGTAGPYAGTGRLDDMGWYRGNSGGRTHPAGRKQPNAFGLHDMLGNVWEWCEDIYDSGFYSKPEARGLDPLCTAGSGGRVGRGGGGRSDPASCRAADRDSDTPSGRGDDLGFRPAAPSR